MSALPDTDDTIMDFEEFEDFLLSDVLAEDSMLLSELDGFLTAIAIGPEIILPPEWLPHVIGSDAPKFETPEQSQKFYNTVIDWYNCILGVITEEPENYEPAIYVTKDGDPVFGDWAYGFMRGMSLRMEAWLPLLESEEYSRHLSPILAHRLDEETGIFLCGVEAYDALYQVLRDHDRAFPDSILMIDRFWKQSRGYYQGRDAENSSVQN